MLNIARVHGLVIARTATAGAQKSAHALSVRNYHSYPDKNEKPVISKSRSNSERELDKETNAFKLNEKFNMNAVFPGTPAGAGREAGRPPATRSTTLDNGITVASQEMPGLMSSFAVIVKAGGSYEKQTEPECTVGATHMLELNGFRSTTSRDHQQIINEVEDMGGMMQCLSTRENILYCIDVLRHNADQALDILADTVQRPLLPHEEIEESKMIVQFQQDELPAEVLSRDAVQRAAYQGSPLSYPQLCPMLRLPAINRDMINKFREQFYVGENMIIAGAGVDHDAFVEQIQSKFGGLPRGDAKAIAASRPPSKYTGGMVLEQRELKEPFVKLAMGFEVGGWHDDMLVPTCVLQQLLGGGSSFSAGGPGKGMYTRLYTQVLNRYHWAESVEAFVNISEDHGLLGIDGSCSANELNSMIVMIIEQFTNLAYIPVTDEELSRAKNMVKSAMMMQLESRLVVCEDIARQFATYGKREMPEVICGKIDAVTAEDLMAVAQRTLDSMPSIGVVGHDLQHVADYEVIKNFINKYRLDAWQKYNQTQ